MPDIREILTALSPDDRAMWSEHRTGMRRSYLNAHNNTVGISNWDHNDDAFLDLIDIKLALLFDRSGRFETTKDILGDDMEKIEKNIHDHSTNGTGDYQKAIKETKPDWDTINKEMSEATKSLKNEWPKG